MRTVSTEHFQVLPAVLLIVKLRGSLTRTRVTDQGREGGEGGTARRSWWPGLSFSSSNTAVVKGGGGDAVFAADKVTRQPHQLHLLSSIRLGGNIHLF